MTLSITPFPRPLIADDASAVASLMAELAAIEPNFGLPVWGIDQVRSTLEQECSLGVFDAAGLQAFVLLQRAGDIIEILHVGTAPRLRRQGIMKRLLLSLIAKRDAGSELWLDVHEANVAAQNLYRKLGFEETARRPGYYADGASALLYNLR